ncbi:hypothetical protein EYF80_051107 [Liparis tanakae]|uniref:Uncharacterized protein n=1 Tax=Liparis tanakae TaxID=230148 RepID=A0A4Z2FBS7_9TELE|nr:hypothetical protein EYF80_051107 [Liparis tanakae]
MKDEETIQSSVSWTQHLDKDAVQIHQVHCLQPLAKQQQQQQQKQMTAQHLAHWESGLCDCFENANTCKLKHTCFCIEGLVTTFSSSHSSVDPHDRLKVWSHVKICLFFKEKHRFYQ